MHLLLSLDRIASSNVAALEAFSIYFHSRYNKNSVTINLVLNINCYPFLKIHFLLFLLTVVIVFPVGKKSSRSRTFRNAFEASKALI